MRYHSYLNTAKKIIESYTGLIPLSPFLKQYFSKEKKYGSKDRKQIAALCYNYYRLGKAAQHISTDDRILLATFLCEVSYSEFLHFHNPGWNEKITLPVSQKLLFINDQFSINDIFPWTNELSDEIDHEKFRESFLHQPDLFLRIRPGKNETVLKKLAGAAIHFQSIREDCIALPNATKIDPVLEIDREVVVQDANSQRVLDFLRGVPSKGDGGKMSVWDCCAASGGKSILAYDILQGNIDLTVSDIRHTILSNLKKRFLTAGIKNYHSFIADLDTANYQLPTTNCPLPTAHCPLPPAHYPLPTTNFQLVICDAPCTGSGTWSRTPEQLYFFEPVTIDAYTRRQKNIVTNAITQLDTSGILLYITCSVFKRENEEIVDFIKENSRLQLLQMQTLKGYEMKADSMFVAVFRKNV